MNTYLTKKEKERCCGCTMCAFACPTHAITMEWDAEGFAFPVVDPQRCVNCNKCSAVCPVDVQKKYTQDITAHAAYSQNKDTLKASSSGGIFTELAMKMIASGGYVCGCTMDAEHRVKHIVIDRAEDIALLQGSKYVQSDLGNCLEQLAALLKAGKNVLFVGTPCQVSAVKNAMDCPNLLTVDLLCHGVPSQKLFDFYVQYLEHRHNGKLVEIVFRDKEKYGWSIAQRYKIQKKKKCKTYYEERHISEYFSGFLGNVTQRESCYQCPYTTLERMGDITLADFWGVEKVRPELLNTDGTSLVLLNSEKGRTLLNQMGDAIAVTEVNLNEATHQNKNLLMPPARSKVRDFIYDYVFQHGFKEAGKKYLLPKNSYKYRIAHLLNINVAKIGFKRGKRR